MDLFIKNISAVFEKNANKEIAEGQKTYLKNQFDFFGISAPKRREIQKQFLIKKNLPPKKNLKKLVKTLWELPQREYQHFGLELTQKYIKEFEKQDLELFIFMVTNKSWWDTIDFVSPRLIGEYFKLFPIQKKEYIQKWLDSGNIWLQRSSILFQLKYKENLDTDLLSYIINSLLGSKEFFINKAIGWILREYSKINPDWVINFSNKTNLSNLSRKEAQRLISKMNNN